MSKKTDSQALPDSGEISQYGNMDTNGPPHAGSPKGPKLNASQSFQLQLIRNAAKACKLLAREVAVGVAPTGDVLQACSILSGEYARTLTGVSSI